MKKIFTVLALVLVSLAFVGCNYTENKKVQGVGIPEHVEYIVFDNGGRQIVDAVDVNVDLKVETNESLLSLTSKGNQIQFYTYVLTTTKSPNSTIRIWNADNTITEVDTWNQIDSEALSIGYLVKK